MADALVAVRPVFLKPLRYNAREAVVIPDFELVDREPHIAVEARNVTPAPALAQPQPMA